MPKKRPKSTEEHLQTVEYLLAGLLLNRKPDIKQVAKVIGVSDVVITEMFPALGAKKQKRRSTAKSIEPQQGDSSPKSA